MLFLYLDESGNYVFHKNGSEYLIFTALATDNPYTLQHRLCELENRLRKEKIIPGESECFHATEDKQAVRDEVFGTDTVPSWIVVDLVPAATLGTMFSAALGKGERETISIDGGSGPIWSRDGQELFYRAGDDLISVQVKTIGDLVLGARRKLLDLSGYDSGNFHEFDVSADGQRFLLIRTDPGSRPVRLDIILNWFDDLKRRVGSK